MIWIFVALLVGWGNLGTSLLAPTTLLPGGSVAYVLAGIVLCAVSVLAAWRGGVDRASFGLGRSRAWRTAGLGLLAGTVVAALGAAALQVAPLITGVPLTYDPLVGLSAAALAVHIAVLLPLATVLPEEVAFRGALFGLLARRGARAAVVGSAGAFALWHGAVALATVERTTLAGTPWAGPAVAGALALVFVGGIVLAWLRLATGALAATIAAHWSFNATLLVALWALLPAARSE
jgi:membrane protease YdiL (CAAX protease family)